MCPPPQEFVSPRHGSIVRVCRGQARWLQTVALSFRCYIVNSVLSIFNGGYSLFFPIDGSDKPKMGAKIYLLAVFGGRVGEAFVASRLALVPIVITGFEPELLTTTCSACSMAVTAARSVEFGASTSSGAHTIRAISIEIVRQMSLCEPTPGG